MFRLNKIMAAIGTALLAGTFQVALAQTTGIDQATTSVSGNLQKNPDNPGLKNALGRLERNNERRETKEMERVERAGRTEKAERPEKVERPEKIERPEKVERPEKAERPERAERPEKVERQGRS